MKKSKYVKVESDDPQVSVLGPQVFLVYVNIIIAIQSNIGLFANNWNIYILITNSSDVLNLQGDLDNFCIGWYLEDELKYKKNAYSSNLRRKKHSIATAYIINNETIKASSSVKYLGAMLSSDIYWKGHVEMIALKAICMLNFIRIHFWQASRQV